MPRRTWTNDKEGEESIKVRNSANKRFLECKNEKNRKKNGEGYGAYMDAAKQHSRNTAALKRVLEQHNSQQEALQLKLNNVGLSTDNPRITCNTTLC